MPAPTSSATASTSPDPHSPAGSTSPITVSSTSPSRIFTPSIAPSAARMPQRICAASNAGPAGAAVASAPAEEPRTISQFVPTSMKSRTRLSSVSPVASIPATMSGPDVGAERGEEHRGRPRVHGEPEVGRGRLGQRPRRDRERRHRRAAAGRSRARAGASSRCRRRRPRTPRPGRRRPPRTPRRRAAAASRAPAPGACRAPPGRASSPRSARSRPRRTAAAR